MVLLRATQKVLRTLPRSAGDDDTSDTALGDWYVNRIVIDRQPLLLFVSSKSLLAMLAPARDVKNLPNRFRDLVGDRLERLHVDRDVLRDEMSAMGTVRVGRTDDRSVTGQMVDFAKTIPYYLPVSEWDASTLRLIEDRLSETPCRSSRRFSEVIFPHRTAVQLLMERWSTSGTIH